MANDSRLKLAVFPRGTKTMRKATYLAAFGAGTVLAIGAAGAAHAVPSYGYATLGFTNFILSGVVDPTGAPLPGVTGLTDSVTVTDGANYNGFASGGNSAAGNLASGADPAQATSGAGPFPGQNVFTQALTGGSGTRGDAVITGAIASGATSNLTAEGNLTTFGSTAGSNAGSSTTIQATFTATSALSLNLSFDAFATLLASVGTLGDSANVQTSASYTLVDQTTGTTVDAENPTVLNRNAGVTNPTDPFSSIGSPTAFSFTDVLIAGDTYQITLAASVTDILATATGTPPIAEPFSIAVLGAGLMGLAGVARRKRSLTT
jgi:hypothetical protein